MVVVATTGPQESGEVSDARDLLEAEDRLVELDGTVHVTDVEDGVIQPSHGNRGHLVSNSRSVRWCVGAAATTPIDLLARDISNHALPSNAVTLAPPSLAISPAAQMSHSDRPPACTNASNRPLAT